MNYAEDRLDRRARSSCSSSSSSDQLACDLRQAHDAFSRHRRTDHDDADDVVLVRSPADGDADGNAGDTTTIRSSLRELRGAHELAGKTLRDCGRNRRAVFHFGMAWRICHLLKKNGDDDLDDAAAKDGGEGAGEWRSVGDYAQMCELSGFPEVGALALLFYRAGGDLDANLDSMTSLSPVPAAGAAADDDDDGSNREGDAENGGTQERGGCGCGMAGCGASPCFVAFPFSSPVAESILLSLDELSISNQDDAFPTASGILAQLALQTRKSDVIGDPTAAMHMFLSERRVTRGIPSILRYWEGGDMDSQQRETTDDRDCQNCASNNQRRTLPPVILLLLLKLLYSSPISGASLRLACVSMPYLAARFLPASREGRTLARLYKSHWAYYVFIRFLILGERVKKHRRGRVIHHVPVWDVVFGLETQKVGGPKEDEEEKKEEPRVFPVDDETISSYCRSILQACSLESVQSFSECDMSNVHPRQRRSSSFLPRIIHQRMPSLSADPIFFVGDSHVLSLAWQTLCIDTSKASGNNRGTIRRTAVPFPATGMKAWHVRPSTRFFTHYNLHACLRRLSSSSLSRSIILSAGEIDCREGIGGSLLQGYYRDCADAVERTVVEYLSSLNTVAEEYRVQILVMPVAPHAYRSEKNGKSVGRARRRETMRSWNDTLRRELAWRNPLRNEYALVFLLDYEEKLRQADEDSPVGYVLHPSYNADYTHVNSAVLPSVENAILDCGCDLTLL